jgi:ribosome-associated protein
MNLIDFEVRGDHIALDALLKATAVASSRGMAKELITAGEVQVDGAPETRRARKIRAGQEVVVPQAHVRIRIHGPAL